MHSAWPRSWNVPGLFSRGGGSVISRGELLCEIDLEALWKGVGPCIGIERPKLQRVLLAGAAPIPMRLSTSIISLTQKTTQCVLVGFSDGSTGEYDLVVGARAKARAPRVVRPAWRVTWR